MAVEKKEISKGATGTAAKRSLGRQDHQNLRLTSGQRKAILENSKRKQATSEDSTDSK
jgi:hypothetical protein